MIKIILAEDHLLVREGFRSILERDPRFRIVAEASDGIQAVELTEKLWPDILLLDLSLQKMHGLDALARLGQRRKTKVIIVTMHGDMPSVLESLRHGARGFFLKETPSAELVKGIKAIHAGERYICQSLEPKVRKVVLSNWRKPAPAQPVGKGLTSRERVVLQKVAGGLTSERAASALGVSSGTVAKHRQNLMRKIGAQTHVDLVRYAIRNGVITL